MPKFSLLLLRRNTERHICLKLSLVTSKWGWQTNLKKEFPGSLGMKSDFSGLSKKYVKSIFQMSLLEWTLMSSHPPRSPLWPCMFPPVARQEETCICFWSLNLKHVHLAAISLTAPTPETISYMNAIGTIVHAYHWTQSLSN